MNFLCCFKRTAEKKYAPNENKKESVRNHEGVQNENDQSKNAIAVAAATAAAADVAIAAAQSAVRIARLTSMRTNFQIKFLAAVKIQSAFRARLARKAFRALKGLVKLQAMVKGSLVRKNTALTFQSMQALIRAQSRLKSESSPVLLYDNNNVKSQPSLYHRRSHESDHSRSRIDVDACSSISFSTPLPKIRVSDYDSVTKCKSIHRGRPSMSTNNTPKYVNFLDNSPSYHPNYMTNTRSFEGKVRSFSTPKQRTEFCEGVLMKKRVSLTEKVSSRESTASGNNSLNGAVVERLDKSLELSRVY